MTATMSNWDLEDLTPSDRILQVAGTEPKRASVDHMPSSVRDEALANSDRYKMRIGDP